MSTPTGNVTRSLVSLVEAEKSGSPSDFSLNTNLTNKREDKCLDFGFEFRGIPFVVRASAVNQGTNMEIRANLGTLPYTAEDPERRATALAILDTAAGDLGGRIHLTNKQRVVLTERYRFDEALTPAVLLTRAVELVLRTKPYLELLALVVPPPLSQTNAAVATIN